VKRCDWVDDELYTKYHDEEWGVPLHDDRRLLEFLLLNVFQAGLSWKLILTRRPYYRSVFDDFDAAAIAAYDENKVRDLLADPGIVRNRRKVEAVVPNARAFLNTQAKFGSFDAYLWRLVGGRPLQTSWRSWKETPVETPESQALAKDLREQGFIFVGPKLCYAFMQAVGLTNDHIIGCFRRSELLSAR
jgi:DNA-3-methyladenine glycosylase I